MWVVIKKSVPVIPKSNQTDTLIIILIYNSVTKNPSYAVTLDTITVT